MEEEDKEEADRRDRIEAKRLEIDNIRKKRKESEIRAEEENLEKE